MECTQRLESTQELYDTQTERTCPEQVGFLGICGAKHPVLKGPNKIGRDPQTCGIVLNLNSVSRQHAVINVLNSREYMLMDLDSANKTKILNKILPPYIPHPLKDGDTVQFGDIFGVFRLLEEDDALPMTQALDIPETPIPTKHVSKLFKAPTTLIPESPDVSDREDSFITLSVPNGKSKMSDSPFLKPNNKSLLGTSPKTFGRKPSIRSNSLISNPNTSLNESFLSLKSDKNEIDDIHEANTQAPTHINESTDSIYTADTQIPPERATSPSIHQLDTQVPSIHNLDTQTSSIHQLNTQIPTTENLPEVRKVDGQHEMQLDIYAADKENRDIFNADTQPFGYDNDHVEIVNRNKSNTENKVSNSSADAETKEKLNASEEELLFDEIDGEILEEDFHSQNILQDELPFKETLIEPPKTENTIPSKGDTSVVSDGSTDCEDDIVLTQKIPELPNKENKQQVNDQGEDDRKCSKRTTRLESDSSTDCEDIEMAATQIIPKLPVEGHIDEKNGNNPSKTRNKIVLDVKEYNPDNSTDCEDIDLIPITIDDDMTDCEDEVIETKTNPKNDLIEDDIATQVIVFDDKQPLEDMATQIIAVNKAAINENTTFEDMATQVIDEVIPNKVEEPEEVISPFKKPLQSGIKMKSKDIPKVVPSDVISKSIDVDKRYYDCTQDIFDDLCSQKNDDVFVVDDEVVPCSVEDYQVKDITQNIESGLYPSKTNDGRTAKLMKLPSGDSSDLELTPTKVKQFIFTDSDLPNSQEIKKSVMLTQARPTVTESSSDSETEIGTGDQFTPSSKSKRKRGIKVRDLSKMLAIDKLPERVLTRQRIQNHDLKNSAEVFKTQSSMLLVPSYLTEQEDQIDGDIINENLRRLKNYQKSKMSKDSKNTSDESLKDAKNQKNNTSRKKTDNNNKASKEKIKVKIIVKSKSKDTKTEASNETESEKDKTKNKSFDSTSTTRISTRSTRSKKNESGTRSNEKKAISPENNKKESDNKRNQTNKKQETEKSVSSEGGVRRSKRQQNRSKEKNDDAEKAPKSILKKSVHEQSTVYNISTSSSDSPRSMKRSLVEYSDVPSPKRTRSQNTSSNCSITNASLRATPARAMKTHHVLLTAFPSPEVRQKLEKLGAVIVTDVLECSVVLTMQIKRTFKLLCAVGLGRPIVGPGWVQACADTNMIVDPWLYLVKDEQAERRFQFNLQKTLNSKRNFLKGYNVSSTPSVQPNASEMKLIVECSGGTWKEGGGRWVCVSCARDRAVWPALRHRGATVVSTEFILAGVLRQTLDIANNTFPD